MSDRDRLIGELLKESRDEHQTEHMAVLLRDAAETIQQLEMRCISLKKNRSK